MDLLSGNVRIINNGRDRKFFDLPLLDEDGTQKRTPGKRLMFERITLGSRDDEGVADTAQPEIVLDGKKWDQLAKQKGVKGLVDARQILVYPV